MLEQRPIGKTGKTISSIALGCANWGRDISEESAYRIMDYALEKGINLFDTAEVYGGGQSRQLRKVEMGLNENREVSGEMSSSEKIIGRWLQRTNTRDEIVLQTKTKGGSAENIKNALEASLERMKVDRLDIYLMHQSDPNIHISETLEAMDAEVKSGRIDIIGSSNYTVQELRDALATSTSGGLCRFEIVQPEYNLIRWRSEEDLFPLYLSEGLAVTPYNPIGAGFLAGNYCNDRSNLPHGSRFDILPGYTDRYFSERNFETVDRLREKSKELGVHMATLAMAWVMNHPVVTAPIIGAKTTDHVDSALAAYSMEFPPELRSEMNAWARD